MLEEMADGNKYSREFLIQMAVRPDLESTRDQQKTEGFQREIARRADEIMSVVLSLSRNDSHATREWALRYACNFCSGNAIDLTTIEGLVPRLQEELLSGAPSRILAVSYTLIQHAPDTEGLVDALTGLLSDKNATNQYSAIVQLGQLGPRAGAAVPKLVSLLTEYMKRPPENTGSTSMGGGFWRHGRDDGHARSPRANHPDPGRDRARRRRGAAPVRADRFPGAR
jgi:hypothetical protein